MQTLENFLFIKQLLILDFIFWFYYWFFKVGVESYWPVFFFVVLLLEIYFRDKLSTVFLGDFMWVWFDVNVCQLDVFEFRAHFISLFFGFAADVESVNFLETGRDFVFVWLRNEAEVDLESTEQVWLMVSMSTANTIFANHIELNLTFICWFNLLITTIFHFFIRVIWFA